MSVEEYRPVPGFEDYLIGSCGTLLSLKSGQPRPMKPVMSSSGYQHARLSGETRRSVCIHHAVAWAFLGPRPLGADIRHLNGDPLDNRVVNLAYGSRSENVLDSVRHGTHVAAKKINCRQGHAFDEANTRRDRRGRRYCGICHAANSRAYRARKAFRAAGIAA